MVLARIVVDSREVPSGIPGILGRKGLYVQTKTLDVGDYVVGDHVVERKTAQDFIASLYGGRLFEQAQRISQAYSNYLLIVEGDIQEVLAELKNPRVFWGTLITLALTLKFKVFFTLDQQQTADFLCARSKELEERKHDSTADCEKTSHSNDQGSTAFNLGESTYDRSQAR